MMPETATQNVLLKTGEEYRVSLRDGRDVWYQGEKIDDVTAHPATSGSVDALAEIFDAQHNPDTQNVLTYVRPDGARATLSWMIPRTKEDLKRHRQSIELQSRMTFGSLGRLPGTGPLNVVSLAANQAILDELDPRHAGNAVRYVQEAEKNNWVKAGVFVAPQGFRTREADGGKPVEGTLKLNGKEFPARSLQVVKDTDEGIWLRGAKAVGTLGPQANELLIGSRPGMADPASHLWAMVPINSPGITMVCRRSLAHARSQWDHPITGRFDESDAMVFFDDVFVPRERIFTHRVPEVTNTIGRLTVLEHWATLVRMCVKAELMAGLADLVVNSLGTNRIPGVRQAVAEVIIYAQAMRSFVVSAEELAVPGPNETMFPNTEMVTAGRAYAVDHYARMLHILRDLGGPGPLTRFTLEDYEHPEIGAKLSWYLEGYGISAKDKATLMNLLWDLTSDSYSARLEMFERLNGFPPFVIKERLFNEYDRTEAIDHIKRFLGINGAS